MDSSPLFLAIPIVVSAVLGLLTSNNWIAVGIPSIAPAAFAVVRMGMAPNPGFVESLRFVSPFIVGYTIVFAFICELSVRICRGIRSRVFKGND